MSIDEEITEKVVLHFRSLIDSLIKEFFAGLPKGTAYQTRDGHFQEDSEKVSFYYKDELVFIVYKLPEIMNVGDKIEYKIRYLKQKDK